MYRAERVEGENRGLEFDAFEATCFHFSARCWIRAKKPILEIPQ
jgi:hypothetical protein